MNLQSRTLISILTVCLCFHIGNEMIFASLPPPIQPPCPLLGDTRRGGNCDNVVNTLDLKFILSQLTTSNPAADLQPNTLVNSLDHVLAIANLGRASVSPTIAPPPGSDPSFSCLSQSGPLQIVTGHHASGKFEPSVAANKKFDARSASFEIPSDISWGKIMLRGSDTSTHMCWAGGYVTASLSWHGLDIPWEQSKSGFDQSGTFRNTSSAESFHDHMTWTGMHVYNVHDGIRTSNSFNNWTVQHSWFDYIRDDCIENDHIYSGTIFDTLFDGCYVGISTRPSSIFSSAGQTVTIDKILLRMEPMPYPYKWDTKNDPVLYVPGYNIPGTNNPIPFGFGNVFKMEAGNEPNFRITNSTFLLEYNSQQDIFPPKSKVTACSNNTLIWLGPVSETPNHLLTDFPGCFTIITNSTQGKTLWKTRVADWHARHPNVGDTRKPANPGTYTWPRF